MMYEFKVLKNSFLMNEISIIEDKIPNTLNTLRFKKTFLDQNTSSKKDIYSPRMQVKN